MTFRHWLCQLELAIRRSIEMRCCSLSYLWLIIGIVAIHHIVVSQAEAVVLFPNLRCLISFVRLGYSPQKYDQYSKFFRTNSVMQVAQVGHYEGTAGIEEYVKYTDPTFTPFVKSAKVTVGKFINNGYDAKTGLCEFFSSYKIHWKLDPNLTAIPDPFDMIGLVKIYYNLQERYIVRMNSYIAADFNRLMAGVAFNTDNARNFICSDVYLGSCNAIVNTTTTPNTTVCESRLKALPSTEGSLRYVDGNVYGCRTLHAILAFHNPNNHCPHLSFEPLLDPKGRIKCQTSEGVLPTDLFTDAEIQRFSDYAKKMNIDPAKGHNAPY